MTQRALSTEKDGFSSINYMSTKFHSIEEFSSSLNLETCLKAIGEAESLPPIANAIFIQKRKTWPSGPGQRQMALP